MSAGGAAQWLGKQHDVLVARGGGDDGVLGVEDLDEAHERARRLDAAGFHDDKAVAQAHGLPRLEAARLDLGRDLETHPPAVGVDLGVLAAVLAARCAGITQERAVCGGGLGQRIQVRGELAQFRAGLVEQARKFGVAGG